MTHYPEIYFSKALGPNVAYDWFWIAEDCTFRHNGQTYIIPKGYTTDFASVPRLLWTLVPPHGRSARASVKHDFFYDRQIGHELYGHKEARRKADFVFLLECINDGVPRWQAIIMYKAIRWFGGSRWKKQSFHAILEN